MTLMIELGACLYCTADLHEECAQPVNLEADAEGTDWYRCCCGSRHSHEDEQEKIPNAVGRPLLPIDQITDVTSTGRKRAAKLYPIWPGMECEWAGLQKAGGGVFPIIGCNGNTISDVKRNIDLPAGIDSRGDRHHGPDKNVLNNEPGNVHRICSPCHNRWHYKNNASYPGERPSAGEHWYPAGEWESHDSHTKASVEELEENEAYWSKYKIGKVDITD